MDWALWQIWYGSYSLRLDFLSRMLVNLDIDQEIVETVGNLHLIADAMESSQYLNITREGYLPLLNLTGWRGRPLFEISRDKLSFLLEQGFKVQEISSILGVGKSWKKNGCVWVLLWRVIELDANLIIIIIYILVLWRNNLLY